VFGMSIRCDDCFFKSVGKRVIGGGVYARPDFFLGP